MKTHTVKAGETLSAIARQYGIKSWETLYNDKSNEAFRAKRPNPNVIHPGDQINIPDGNSAPPVANYKMAIIDGTGETDNEKYARGMEHSFCRQLGEAIDIKGYQRGPCTWGEDVLQEAKDAYKYLSDAKRADPSVRLMLAGYSRGGSAAIMAAEMLHEKDDFKVDSLFLFDAVARHRHPGGEVIPSNVLFSRHARRDLNAYMVVKYEGTVSDAEVKGVSVVNASNPIRPTFGNTGLTWRGSGDHLPAKPFVGSHGALGGVGWSFVTEDSSCQEQVAAWMNTQLESRGVWNGLKSFAPAPSQPKSPGAFELITGLALDAVLLAKHKKNVTKAGAAN